VLCAQEDFTSVLFPFLAQQARGLDLDLVPLERLVDALGPPRETDELTRVHENVARSLQEMLEEAYLHLVRSLQRRTGLTNICLAGGVSLNAVANGRIRPETPFDGVYVQPAAGDSGTAVGAAFHVWHEELGRPRAFVMEHAYTGPEYSDAELASALARAGLAVERVGNELLFAEVAERLAAGDVVAWFQGRMEFGPRALLNTSFNENEPIVMTPEEAVRTFLETRIDLLVLGNLVVRRHAAEASASDRADASSTLSAL
jgi:predicted NodU family carbamoyl transferase